MKRWLVKSEPTDYAFADLVREKKTVWDGITNNLALIHLRAMKKGDEVLVYHSGKDKAVLGTATIAKGPYPDPARDDPKIVVVDLQAGSPLPRPVTLKELKAEPSLAKWELVTSPRLSVMPVPAAAWKKVQALSKRPA